MLPKYRSVAKTAGVDTDLTSTQIASIKQGITNAEIQEKILKYEERIQKVEANISEQTSCYKMQQITDMAEQAN